MSRKSYSQEEREAIRASMLRRASDVFATRGLRDTSLEDIYVPEGISKTFFYTFVPSTLSLISEIFRIQSGEILEAVRSSVWEYGSLNGMRAVFNEVVDGRWYIASVDDQAYLKAMMSEDEFNGFKNDRIVLFAEILNILGVPVSRLDPRVFYNMLMSVVWTGCSGSGSIPFMYGEVTHISTEIQLERLIEYIAGLRVDSGQSGF